jgi:protein-S-isoprenylcysteine O-methyltransferase Ste14
MDQVLSIAPLLLTLVLRQVMESALRRDAPSRKPPAGKASIVFWYLAYFMILVLAVSRVWSIPLMSQPWWGYAVLWSGIVLRLVSLREIGVYYHSLILIRDEHRLVDTGPYGWLRHPLHLGLHLEMVGLALLADAALGWIALGLSLIVLMQRNLQEERAMENFFGAAYHAYRCRAWDVIDLLPRLQRGRR